MGRILVSYFSASGTTKRTAEHLASLIGADIYEIEPKQPYSAYDLNWTKKDSRSTLESKDPSSRPELKESVNLEGYDTILVGFPIWWYDAPRIVLSFLESADFSKKRIVIFATSGGTKIEGIENKIKKALKHPYTIEKGMLLNNSKSIEEFAKQFK